MEDEFIKKINGKTADEWFNIALDEKDLNKQIKCYSNCLKLNPKHVDAWTNKGVALYKLERYMDVIKAYDKAIEIDPKNAYVWYNKGITLYKLERYREAINAYDKAIKINPKDADAWKFKGIALYKLERYEDSIKAYDKAIKIDPKDEIVKRILKLIKKILIAKEELKHVEETLIAEEKLKHIGEILITKEKSEHVEYSVISIPNIIKSPVRLCLVQLDFQITDIFSYQLKMKESVKEKILKALEVATKKEVNIICFPELSFAEEFIHEVKEYKDIIIIGGSYYHDNFNVCPVIINKKMYSVYKIHPAPHSEIEITLDKGMKSGNDIKIFKSEDGRFKFVVLICIDYLKESDRLYRHQKGINFIFNPSFNSDIKRFQRRANSDCENYHVDLIQTNVKEYGGTCIIGIEHKDIIGRLIKEGYRPNDEITYKLCEARDETMIITDLNLRRVEVPTPLDASPRIRIIGRYKYENEYWQEYKSDH